MTSDDKRKYTVAIKYLERLMSGHHPVNNSIIENDTIFNDDNVQRCFSFIIDVLKKASNCEEEYTFEPSSVKYERCLLTLKPEANNIMKNIVQQREISVREMETLITDNLKNLVEENVEKIPITRISNYLLDEGYLCSITDETGKNHREASDKGKAIGITNNLVQPEDKESYIQYRFTPNAQMFVLEHLSEINTHIKVKA